MEVREEALRHQISLRLERLRALPFEDLAALPPHAGEDVQLGSKAFDVWTYRDEEEQGLRIVVQIGPKGRGVVWTSVFADGFHVSRAGDVTPATQRELYGFI